MIDHDQDTMRYGNERFLLSNPIFPVADTARAI
jgi:hypothetical protein